MNKATRGIYVVRTGEYIKFGYTKNWEQRKAAYITSNPMIEFVGFIATYKKTGRTLETAIHKELRDKGYQFNQKDGVKTEWVYMPNMDDNAVITLVSSIKNRKVMRL